MNRKEVISSIRSIKHRCEIPIMLRAVGVKNICEVGVDQGANLKLLATADPKYLVGVDVWLNGIPKKVRKFVKNSKCKIRLLHMYSKKAHKYFGNEFFDYIYIDANHKEKFVAQDIKMWWPKVKKGGIFAGHDFTTINYGVKRAVRAFVKNNKLVEFFHVVSGDSAKSWIALKRI